MPGSHWKSRAPGTRYFRGLSHCTRCQPPNAVDISSVWSFCTREFEPSLNHDFYWFLAVETIYNIRIGQFDQTFASPFLLTCALAKPFVQRSIGGGLSPQCRRIWGRALEERNCGDLKLQKDVDLSSHSCAGASGVRQRRRFSARCLGGSRSKQCEVENSKSNLYIKIGYVFKSW